MKKKTKILLVAAAVIIALIILLGTLALPYITHFTNGFISTDIEFYIDGNEANPELLDSAIETKDGEREKITTDFSKPKVKTDGNRIHFTNYILDYGVYEMPVKVEGNIIVFTFPHLNNWDINTYDYRVDIDTEKNEITYDCKYTYYSETKIKKTEHEKETEKLQETNRAGIGPW